jgi:signal transduction histidine kinase
VREAIRRAEPRTTLLQAQIAARIPKHPVLVEVDPDHIGRILDALINNALIYTTGSPRVTVTVSDGAQPQVAVEDRGAGVPPELRERIFERFFRIDHRAANAQPGTGLGLYISQVLAEKNGGSLVLERSEPGKGSRFVLRLPVAVPTEEESPAKPAGPTVKVREISSSRTVKPARRPAEAKTP